MVEKVLFHGVPSHTAEGDITTGPGSGKVWIVTALWIVNTNAAEKTLTLKHYLDASNTMTIIPETTFLGKQTEIVGPLVIQNGQKIRALQEEEDAIEVIAYGLEGDA